MPLTHPLASVNDAFFQPQCGLAAASQHTRSCPGFPDANFLLLGVQRVPELSASGRAFLQEHGVRFEHTPGHCNYFATLHRPRRRDVLRDTHRTLLAHARPALHDRLAGLPELAGYEIFATDGHWHQAATQAARHDGRKMAVGHFYSLKLRAIPPAAFRFDPFLLPDQVRRHEAPV